MPRPLRLDGPGAIHHVTTRGVERRTIFLDDRDREDFLGRLGGFVLDLDFTCLAWALLPNHVHLVLRTGSTPLARLMARLTSPYAQRFNRERSRVGHLFQGRYKARLIENDADLLNAVVYVVGNPVRHGIVTVEALACFPWSSFGPLAGTRAPLPFERAQPALRLFPRKASERRSFLEAEIRARTERAAIAVETALLELVDQVLRTAGLDRSQLHEGTRAAASARAAICARASRELRCGVREIARTLGMSPSSVSRMISRCNTGV